MNRSQCSMAFCIVVLCFARSVFSAGVPRSSDQASDRLKARGEKFLKETLQAKAKEFGEKNSDVTKNGIRLASGDLFLSKKIHALAFFKYDEKNKNAGVVLFEKGTDSWALKSVWLLGASAEQLASNKKKVKAFQLRNLSSDKAPEILLLEAFQNKLPRYQILRYVRKDSALKSVATKVGDPYWDSAKKEVLAFDWISNDKNMVVGWRWYKGNLVPLWRCVQRTVKGKTKKVLILAFHKREKDQWILMRRCRGNIPFYANPAPREILAPIYTNGEMAGRLSTYKKSYRVTAKLGVMRIASFEMGMRDVLDQFSRGLFSDPDNFGPKFKLLLPTEERMYIAQFGRVRVYPEEHAAWKVLVNEKEVVTHARALLTAIGNQDVFALFKLLPTDGLKSLLHPDGKSMEALRVEDAEIFLDAMPELLQPQSGTATPTLKGEELTVVVNAFPASPSGQKAKLTCAYLKLNEGWTLKHIQLGWEIGKKN